MNVILDFVNGITLNSISISGTANVTFTIAVGSSTATNALTITLGGAGTSGTALTIAASRSLTLQVTTSGVTGTPVTNTGSGTTISIPTGYTASISGNLLLGVSTAGTTTNGIGQSQSNKLIGVDANSIIFNNGSNCYSYNSQGGSAYPFGATSTNNNVVEFKSGAKFLYYQGGTPFGSAAAPASVVQFDQGSTYAIFGGSSYPSFAGRTLGTLQLGNGAVASVSNATAYTTTVLDSLIVTAGTVTMTRGTGGTASPTFSFNNIRVTNNNAASSSTNLIFGNNGFDNASYTISGGILITTLNINNATITWGSTNATTASASTVSVTLSGVGQTISTIKATSGIPSIVMANVSGQTPTRSTNITFASGASYSLNTSIDLTTADYTSNIIIKPTATLSVGSGATLTTNGKLTVQSDATGSGNIGNSGGTISGSVTVQRYIPGKRAFRFLSHPYSSALALSSLSNIDITGAGGSANGFTTTQNNNPSAFYYDPTVGNSATSPDPGWTAFADATSTNWASAQGIRILIRGAKNTGLDGNTYTPAALTLSTSGTLNSGNKVVTLTNGTSSSFNLIGNPYASAVDLSATARGSNIGANFYVWDATAAGTNGRGAYVSQPFSSSFILPSGAAFLQQLQLIQIIR